MVFKICKMAHLPKRKKNLIAPHSLNRLKRWHLAKHHLVAEITNKMPLYVIPCHPMSTMDLWMNIINHGILGEACFWTLV
jgi:hypothetical protein